MYKIFRHLAVSLDKKRKKDLLSKKQFENKEQAQNLSLKLEKALESGDNAKILETLREIMRLQIIESYELTCGTSDRELLSCSENISEALEKTISSFEVAAFEGKDFDQQKIREIAKRLKAEGEFVVK